MTHFTSKFLAAPVLAAALSLGALPVAAQQNGLVNVNISDIDFDDILSNNNVNVQVPVTAVVQIPIGLAANVCGVAVGVLSGFVGTNNTACTADSDLTNQGEAIAIARAAQRM